MRNRCRTGISLLVLLISGCTAIGRNETTAPSAADVRQEVQWVAFNGGYDATRFSTLTQIDTKNVATLREVARFKLPETMSFQCDPVVIAGTMYLTTRERTYAIDARTGEQRWGRSHELKDPGPGRLGRGAAYAKGRGFRGRGDGHVVALDARTGDVIWGRIGADGQAAGVFTALPVRWRD